MKVELTTIKKIAKMFLNAQNPSWFFYLKEKEVNFLSSLHLLGKLLLICTSKNEEKEIVIPNYDVSNKTTFFHSVPFDKLKMKLSD